jgi:RTX calcium-binding nonapeptide repeat (4 copies)
LKPRLSVIGLSLALVLCGALVGASGAAADFHLVKIKEVSGSDGHNRATYIELQMYSPGQTNLAGHNIQIWDASGVVGGMFVPIATIPIAGANPTNGENQRTILIGDINVPNPDYTMPELDTYLDADSAGNVLPAGAICFEAIPVDCVSWGGSNFFAQSRIPDHSEPYFQPLLADFSLRRRIDKHGCVTALDAADDTNDNAVDFVQGNREPTPNSATPKEKPCSTANARCGGLAATSFGTPGPNVIVGTTRRDVIAGLGGNDKIRGLAGNDVLCGGAGRDKLIGGGGRDRLLGQAGRDVCKGGPKKDTARKCETKRTI